MRKLLLPEQRFLIHNYDYALTGYLKQPNQLRKKNRLKNQAFSLYYYPSQE